MSIKIVMQAKEGLAVESTTVSEGFGLGFGSEIAQLISKGYRDAVAKDPAKQGIKAQAFKGQLHPLMQLLGLPYEPIDTDFRIYPLGELPDGATMDLWLSETPEGDCILAFNQTDARDQIADDVLPGIMQSLWFAPDELDEVLEALGTDLSGEPSIEAEEAEA